MCRNITELRGLEPPATREEIEAAAWQYVRKVTGVTHPSGAIADDMRAVADHVAVLTEELLDRLPSRRQPPVIAVTQHDRQRNEAQRDHRGSDDPGRRREQGADHDHRKREPAADGPEELADGVEQVLGHARAFENKSHEGEKRNREQNVIVHDPVDALRQCLQEIRTKQPELDADQGEDEAIGGERECNRIAEQQEDHERREHDWRHVVDERRHHHRCSGLLLTGVRSRLWRWQ